MICLEDALIAANAEIAPVYQCACGYKGPAFAFSCEEGNYAEWVCNHCVQNALREQTYQAEQAAAAALELSAPWETERGKELKLQRNRRIEAALWAVDPLTSPLSSACQTAFCDYVAALHRITVDFATPDELVWPVEPELEYPE